MAIVSGKTSHVRELVRPIMAAQAGMLMQAASPYLFLTRTTLSAQRADVIGALLEVGGASWR